MEVSFTVKYRSTDDSADKSVKVNKLVVHKCKFYMNLVFLMLYIGCRGWQQAPLPHCLGPCFCTISTAVCVE